jgi:hypothetical protein
LKGQSFKEPIIAFIHDVERRSYTCSLFASEQSPLGPAGLEIKLSCFDVDPQHGACHDLRSIVSFSLVIPKVLAEAWGREKLSAP